MFVPKLLAESEYVQSLSCGCTRMTPGMCGNGDRVG